MRNIILSVGMVIVMAFLNANAYADPFRLSKKTSVRLAERQAVPESKFLPGKPRARAGEKRAASRAKQAFPNSKILSVNYLQRNSSYRVKLLSRGGVVKYVFVDGDNGEVFE